MFDKAQQRRSKGNRGAIRHLRHKGKVATAKITKKGAEKFLSALNCRHVQKKPMNEAGWAISRRIQFWDNPAKLVF